MKKKIFLLCVIVAALICAFTVTTLAVEVDGIDYSFSEGEATVTPVNKSCKLTVVDIPETVTYEGVTYTVTAIASQAFRSNSSITSVTIPSSVTTVGDEAFYQCGSLTNAVFEGADTALGNKIFMFCGKLTSASLPTNITKIPNGTFFGVGTSASPFTIPNLSECTKLTTIGEDCFRDSKEINISIPDTVTTIEERAFQAGCSSGSISIGRNSQLQVIGDNAFTSCTAIKSIYIPSSVTSIGTGAFSGCGNLTTFENFENCQITVIEASLFEGLSKLTSIKLPETVTTIEHAFIGNKNLNKVYIPKSVTEIADTFLKSSWEVAPTKIVFVFTGSDASVLSTCQMIAGANVISASDYDDSVSYSGINLVTGYSHCVTYFDGVHEEYISAVSLTSYLEKFELSSQCKECGTPKETEEINPIFTCYGYSYSETDVQEGISIRYTVDFDSLEIYESVSGIKLNYGLFVTANKGIGTSDVLDEENKALDGVVTAEISDTGFFSFEIKLVGLENNQETAFAIGTYVIEEKENEKEFVYLQLGEPKESEKYYFASYNDIVSAK